AFLAGSQVGSLSCSPETSDFRAQAWLTNVIAVDPVNPDRVWVGGIDLFRSDDGGANWGIASYWYANGVLKPRAAAYTHADQMVLAFHPRYNGTSNRTLFVTNDGGVYRTGDALAATSTAPCNPAGAGIVWSSLNNNFGVTQFYHGAPYPNGATYFGGTQDNGTLRGSDASGAGAWNEIHFGDGGYVAVDPLNTNTLFAENTGLSIHKSTDGGATFRPAISGITESRNDFLFITPFAMDPSDPRRLWTGGFFIWRTGNGAEQWERAAAITAGLGSVSAIAVAPADSNYVLAGMSTGEVLRTTTGLSSGASTIWPYTSPRPNAFISSVAFDPINKNTVYATSSTFGGAHVFKSMNGGANWTALDGAGAGRIPDIPVHAIVIDPANTQRLYAGADLGVFVSTNGGATWAVENTGFANVVTESLALNVVDGQTQLFAFTFGRGGWRVATNTAGCNFSLSAPSQTFPNTETVGTVNVTAAPGTCAWTAASNSDWITVTGGASGAGNGAVRFSLTPNTTNSPRAGTITIAGRSFNVTQQGCQYTLSQTSRVMEAAGGQGSVNVAVEGANCSWFASSNAGWITIQTTSGGVNYTVAANAGLFGRSGTLTIAGQSFTILQAGMGANCAATPITLGQTRNGALGPGDCLSPARGGNRFADRYSFSGTAGQQVAILQASPAIDAYLYLIGPNGAIVAQDDDGGGGTNARIPAGMGFLTLPASGTYLIEATTLGENGSGDYTISLTIPCSFALSVTGQTFTAGGGTGSVNVTAPGGCNWTATSDSSWLTVTSGASGSGNGTVNFSVALNTATTASRTGKLTIAGQTFTATQTGSNPAPTLASVNPNPVVAGGPAFTLTVNGRDFVAGSVVRWDGGNRPTTLVNSTRLTATISASDIAAPRGVKITVFTPDGGGSSNEVLLTVAGALANVPAASFTGTTIAPDSIVAAFGTKLATAIKVATTTPLPTELEGTTVKVADSAGAERLARLFFVSPTQINYLMPAETVAGPATVTVRSGDGSISVGAVQIAPALPALFTANASGQGIAAGVVLRVKTDGAQVYEPIARFDPAQNRFAAEPIDLSNANEQVFLILYGSGIRYRSSLSTVSLTIGGTSQPVLFAGAVEGLAGLDQLNIGPLSSSLAGRGEVDVVLTVDGRQANTVRINIK
ncbi:MAG: BACON domain-containing protein, partial [Blastocatellia bacterium]